MECPHCQKELQVRYLFHHIRVHHISEFHAATQTQWIADAENGRPLKIHWDKMNDFDELETVVLYACLATDKCFMTEERGVRHFKHDPAALKKHNAELRKLKKELTLKIKKEQQLKAQNPIKYLVQTAQRDKDPRLTESLWRGLLHWKKGCDLAVTLGNSKFKQDFEFVTQEIPRKYMPWPEAVQHYVDCCHKARSLLSSEDVDQAKLMGLYNKFWSFLEYFKTNYKEVSDLDPRLNYNCKESIVVQRDVDVLEEKFFYYATSDMPIPLASDLLPVDVQKKPELPQVKEETIAEEAERVIPVPIRGMTKEQTFNMLRFIPPDSRDWNNVFRDVVTQKVSMPPEASSLLQSF